MSEFIDVLLAESELSDDALLRDLLGELERETTTVRPIPSAALSELLSPRPAPSIHVGTRSARRRPSFAARSAIIASAAVIGAVGLGAGAAAAAGPQGQSAIGAGFAAIAHLFEPAPASELPAPTKRGAHPPAVGNASEPLVTPTPTHGAPGAIHASPGSSPSSGLGTGSNASSGVGSAAGADNASGAGADNASGAGSGPSADNTLSSTSGDSHGGGGSDGRGSGGNGSGGNGADAQSGHGGGSGHDH